MQYYYWNNQLDRVFPGCTGSEVVLSVKMSNPIMHHNSRGQTVKLSFSCEHQTELEEAAQRVFMVSVFLPVYLLTCGSSLMFLWTYICLSPHLSCHLSVLCITREHRAPPKLKTQVG